MSHVVMKRDEYAALEELAGLADTFKRDRDEARERARGAEERLLGSRAIVGVLEPKLREAEADLARLREGVEQHARQLEELLDDPREARMAAAALRALLSPEAKCPTCGSTDPSLHPGIGVLGIADPCPDPFHLSPEADDGTPNGGEHCAPPGGPNNVCFRHPDGRCDACGFSPEADDEWGKAERGEG